MLQRQGCDNSNLFYYRFETIVVLLVVSAFAVVCLCCVVLVCSLVLLLSHGKHCAASPGPLHHRMVRAPAVLVLPRTGNRLALAAPTRNAHSASVVALRWLVACLLYCFAFAVRYYLLLGHGCGTTEVVQVDTYVH